MRFRADLLCRAKLSKTNFRIAVQRTQDHVVRQRQVSSLSRDHLLCLLADCGRSPGAGAVSPDCQLLLLRAVEPLVSGIPGPDFDGRLCYCARHWINLAVASEKIPVAHKRYR